MEYLDDIRKSARERAKRRWHNHAVEKSFKEARNANAESPAKEPKSLEPADVIEQDRRLSQAVTKFESKFIKDMRAMLNEHQAQNQLYYLLSLQQRKKRLLFEKLKRLQAMQGEPQ